MLKVKMLMSKEMTLNYFLCRPSSKVIDIQGSLLGHSQKVVTDKYISTNSSENIHGKR